MKFSTTNKSKNKSRITLNLGILYLFCPHCLSQFSTEWINDFSVSVNPATVFNIGWPEKFTIRLESSTAFFHFTAESPSQLLGGMASLFKKRNDWQSGAMHRLQLTWRCKRTSRKRSTMSANYSSSTVFCSFTLQRICFLGCKITACFIYFPENWFK